MALLELVVNDPATADEFDTKMPRKLRPLVICLEEVCFRLILL